MNRITLPRELKPDEKLKIITEVYGKIEDMIMHFDVLRLRNLSFAVIVFAGLFGLRTKITSSFNLLFLCIPLVLLMVIFLLVDRKYHVYSHGFQGSSYKLIHRMREVRKEGDLSFEKYDYAYAKEAEWICLNSIIYFSLIVGGIISYFILPYVRMPNSGT